MPAAYSEDFRLAILRRHHLGDSPIEIARDFAISSQTVYRYISSKSIETKYANCWSFLLDNTTKTDAILAAIEDPFGSARNIIQLLDLDVSKSTFNRILITAGLMTRNSATKIKISPVHR